MLMPIVCPACRHAHPSPSALTRRDGGWFCGVCTAFFPQTLAPIVAHPLGPFVQAVGDAHGADVPTLVSLAPWLADDSAGAQMLSRVAVATRAHYGDRVSPSVQASWATWRPFLDVLPTGGDLCELGCGAGRIALELAVNGRRVVALDSDPATMALGVGLRDFGRAQGAVRVVGATYRDAVIEAPELAGREVTFILGDALNPPLPAEGFDAVVCLNVLDNVRVPSTLIGQIDALLKPGGVVLLATPYAWDSLHTEDGARIGGASGRPFGGNPPDELVRLLRGDAPGIPWALEILLDERVVPYTLARDERTRFVYDTHVIIARKPR